MSNEFVYTTYIKSTPEKVWNAIINPEFTRQYWGHQNVSDWKKGSKWHMMSSDDKATVFVAGEVIESSPPKRLVLTWADPSDATDTSRVTYELEPIADMVRLSIVHGNFKAGSDMPHKIGGGWPMVLSSMKSFLETGKPIDIMALKAALGQSCGKNTAA